MTPDQAHHLIHDLFDAFTAFDRPAEETLRLLTPDYHQRVDGKILNRDGFLDHVRALRSVLTGLSIVIEHFVSDGTCAASVHVAHAVRASGETTRVRVVAFYTFRDGLLAGVDELTRPMEGDDATLGSLGLRDA